MARWQEYLERLITSLGVAIAVSVYVFLFATAAIYTPFSRFAWAQGSNSISYFGSNMLSRRHLSGWKGAHSSSTPAFSFTNATELLSAVDVWLEDKDKATLHYGPISMWNVSLVDNMAHLFEDAVELVHEDLSRWDVSQVKNMSCMFRGAKRFTSESLQKWNTSQVEDFSFMFEDSDFRGDLSEWNVQAGKNFNFMFHGAKDISFKMESWGAREEIFHGIREVSLEQTSESGGLSRTMLPISLYHSQTATDDSFGTVDALGKWEKDWESDLGDDDHMFVETDVKTRQTTVGLDTAVSLGCVAYGVIMAALLTARYRGT